jgi:hypothetical protein
MPLGLFSELNDQAGQAHALDHLGAIDSKVGRYRHATGHLHRALDMFRRAGDRSGEAHVLLGPGSRWH